MVTAYDFESASPGSNPEWSRGQYTMRLRTLHMHGLTELSALRDSTLGTRAAEQVVTGACKLIDGCSLALCSATDSVVSAGICHRINVNSIV